MLCISQVLDIRKHITVQLQNLSWYKYIKYYQKYHGNGINICGYYFNLRREFDVLDYTDHTFYAQWYLCISFS